MPTRAATLALAASLLATAAAAQDWSGPYAGLTFGAIRSTGQAARGEVVGPILNIDVSNGLLPASIDDADASALGGVRLGYNVQRGRFVGGVEVGYELTDSEAVAGFSRVDPQPNPIFNGQITVTSYETEIDGLATATLRGGRAFGDTLVFGSAGLALGRVENRFSLRMVQLGYRSPDWSESGSRLGFVVGAGVERRVTERLSVAAEVAYYDLEDATVFAEDPASFPGESVEYRFDNAGVVARVGVNIRF